MSSSFLRDFYRRYYGKEMLQRALCLLTVHRKKPYNNSGSFEKRKEIIFMSHKIIKPEGIELIEYLNNGYAICNRCGAVMRQAEDPKTGCGVYICPSWNKEIFRQPDAEPAEDHTHIAKRHVSYLMTKNIIERRSMLWHRLFLFGE